MSPHRRSNPGRDLWLLHGQSSSADADPGGDVNRYLRSENQNPGGWAGVLVSMATRSDQVGMAITFVGAVTWFDESLTLVMSNE